MSEHPDPKELQAFRERRLPPAAMLRLDRHVAACASCRTHLQALAGAAAPGRLIAAVVAAGPHLSYEQLEGLVDHRLDGTQQRVARGHLQQCAMCRRELADLEQHASALRQPLAAPAKPAPGWWASLTSWGPRLALATVLGAVALTLVVQEMRPGVNHAESMQSTTSGDPALGAWDHSALEQLDGVSAQAAQAWRDKDYAHLVALLQPLTEQSQPQALAAMASLYAQGLGVAQDWKKAEQLWQRAAVLGHAGAAANLKVLKQTGR